MKKIKIEIFGKGCKNCDRLEENTKEVMNNLDIPYEVVKIKDMDEIVDRGVFKTPGLALNGRIVSTGKVLSKNRIKEQIEGLQD